MDQYSDCSLAFTSEIPTFMYTTKPKPPPGDTTPIFHQIQFCPFFLNYGLSTQWKWTTFFEASFWSRIGTALAKELAIKSLYTTVDALLLFDKMMLHEVRRRERAVGDKANQRTTVDPRKRR